MVPLLQSVHHVSEHLFTISPVRTPGTGEVARRAGGGEPHQERFIDRDLDQLGRGVDRDLVKRRRRCEVWQRGVEGSGVVLTSRSCGNGNVALTINASGGSPNYGRYIGYIVGQVETDGSYSMPIPTTRRPLRTEFAGANQLHRPDFAPVISGFVENFEQRCSLLGESSIDRLLPCTIRR
jgi:hypothetical protein